MVGASKRGVRPRAEVSSEKRFKGVRKRSWGKWVSEIRLPNTRARLWLGSYATAEQAARAFDVAVVCLRGSSAVLNFPDSPPTYAPPGLPHHQIQALAYAAAATVPPARPPPTSPSSADTGCHEAMPSPEASSMPMRLQESGSETASVTNQASYSMPEPTESTFVEERLSSAELHSWALPSFSGASAALPKDLLPSNCGERDAPLRESGELGCWTAACTAPLPVVDDDEDDGYLFWGPHCLWSL